MEGILSFQLPFGLVRLKDPRKNVSWWACLRRIQDGHKMYKKATRGSL